MDGTRGNRSDLTIDGVPSTATANAGEVIASYVPPADIVQEFKVQTATFDAGTGKHRRRRDQPDDQVGHQHAARHGLLRQDAEEPLRERLLRQRQQHPARADFDYNRYGGMAGGPMMLPGYNGKGQTFFMYGFEGIHESRPRNNGTPTVPTEKMRNGDFSELLALGPQYQIYNPFTRRADRRRPLPAGSVPRQHHSAEPDQSRVAGGARVLRASR